MTAGSPRPRPTGLLVTALLIALWAVLPPYSGPELQTETRKEIADHVVPAILLLALLLAAVFGAWRSPFTMLALGLGTALSGLWMTATHVPLVGQAFRHEVTWGATVWHTLPGVAVLTLGAVWAWRYLDEGVEAPG